MKSGCGPNAVQVWTRTAGWPARVGRVSIFAPVSMGTQGHGPSEGTAAASRTGRGAQKPTEQHLHVWKHGSQSQLRGEGLAVGTSHNSPPPLPLGVRYSPVYWTCSGRAHSVRPEEGLRAPQPQDGDSGT